MGEASYEARKRTLESALPEQIEVRVHRERRRRWTVADKLRIVEEAFAPGAVAKRVAERYEISTGLLFTWRRQLTTDIGVGPTTGFLPVQVMKDAGRDPAVPTGPTTSCDGMIEVEMPSGARVRIGHGADLKILRGVLTVLDGR
jgi:transposase